ncbi:MAG: cell division protein FtsQ/DivIB, partial [Pseudomonadota bacterium]
RALVRVGERRWDLVLDRDLRVLLPEKEPSGAVARIMALHLGEDQLLERDLQIIDMRIPNRPVLRMPERAVETWRRQQILDDEEGEDT